MPRDFNPYLEAALLQKQAGEIGLDKLSDHETYDGVESTWSPLDFVGPGEMSALARAIRSQIPRNLTKTVVRGGAEPALFNISNNVKPTVTDLMYGAQIHRMSPKELAYRMSQLSAGRPKEFGLMLNGAALRERIGTDKPEEIVKIVSKHLNVREPKYTNFEHPDAAGYFAPNKYEVNAAEDIGDFPDHNAVRAGVTRHEMEHVKDYNYYPNFESKPEFLTRGSKTIQEEEGQMRLSEALGLIPEANDYRSPYRRLQTIQKLLQDNKTWKTQKGIPRDFIWDIGDSMRLNKDDLIKRINSGQLSEREINLLNKIQDNYLNQSRLGDPLFVLEQQSHGHFHDYPSFESAYAQILKAKEAIKRGEHVDPEILSKYKHLIYPKK